MDFLHLFLLLCTLLGTCFYVLKSFLRPRPNLPPGPPPLPIIGNILQLGENPHQSLAKLSKNYGPIMHLKLGSLDTVVVSSPELAKQVLQKHDQVLSSRFQPAVSAASGHNTVSLVWLPTGDRWRVLRKICKDQLFSLQRLDSSQGLRREKLKKLHDYVQNCCDSCRVVDIAEAASTTLLNIFSASLFSVDFSQIGSDRSHELKETLHNFVELLGAPNLADYFPILKPVDPQGFTRKWMSYFGEVSRIFNDIIDQRLESQSHATGSKPRNDLLEDWLDMSRRNESELNRNDIIHLFLVS
ncbi:cytochrome [Sesamum alatum]|uniref:Cytochrome n=1 Tax=Sesamum alatum TaxID=300844 RepID=A0AAE1YQR4_9LAMI|nr:cytochrome [Sesamum alatum]